MSFVVYMAAEERTYDEGDSVTTPDGHLHVLDSDRRIIAAFAPGTWFTADKVGSVQIKET